MNTVQVLVTIDDDSVHCCVLRGNENEFTGASKHEVANPRLNRSLGPASRELFASFQSRQVAGALIRSHHQVDKKLILLLITRL